MQTLNLPETNDNAFAISFVKRVQEYLDDVKNTFFLIGFRLDEAMRCGYVKKLGYENIADLSRDYFDLEKTTTYNLINVYRFFRSKDDPMRIDVKFRAYSQSQLIELMRSKWAISTLDIKPADSCRNLHRYIDYANECFDRGCEPKYGLSEYIMRADIDEKVREGMENLTLDLDTDETENSGRPETPQEQTPLEDRRQTNREDLTDEFSGRPENSPEDPTEEEDEDPAEDLTAEKDEDPAEDLTEEKDDTVYIPASQAEDTITAGKIDEEISGRLENWHNSPDGYYNSVFLGSALFSFLREKGYLDEKASCIKFVVDLREDFDTKRQLKENITNLITEELLKRYDYKITLCGRTQGTRQFAGNVANVILERLF